MTKKQHLLKALLLIMTLAVFPNLHLHAQTDIDNIFDVDDQFFDINMDDDVRAFHDSYIKVNPDGNADMRITGSATILGLITFPASIQNATSGLPVVINSAGQLGVGTPTFTSDLSVCNGTLFVNEIDPCSPTTTTSFSGSINLPLATTANNGSLQIAGTPFLHNFGIDNTFVGVNAGNLTMSGDSNVAVGDTALSANTSGLANTAVGSLSLLRNTIGIANTALGANTLMTNDTGNFNTAIGSNSLVSNISGEYNTVVGLASLTNNLTGSTNTTLGVLSLAVSQDSSGNTALGASTLSNFRIGTSGSHTGVGNLSLSELITGTANTALGIGAGNGLIIGSNNIYIGSHGVGIEDGVIRIGTAITHTGCFIPTIANTAIVSGAAVVIDAATGKLGIGTPTFTCDLSVCNGTLFVNEIDPCSPTTTTSFSGSINLPLATTSNNGSLQIDGTPFLHNFGTNNTFAGANAGNLTMGGSANVAIGNAALNANTSGLGNTAVGSTSLTNNTVGIANTALGANTLTANITGSYNTAIGPNSLFNNTTGNYNTAIGLLSLSNNITSSYNTAVGILALTSCKDSESNTGIGGSSISNFRIGTDGRHSAVGSFSLAELITGTDNTALGYNAGGRLRIGSNNIYVGNRGVGIEDNIIRLGTTTTHTGCFVAGVSGQTTSDIISTLPVLISSDGKLGTILSSRRYKDEIRSLQTQSNDLTKLRPVAFVYKNDPTKTIQYGLIAEEVAQVYPELVVYDDHGQPQSVMYHELPILLLNEYQQHDLKLLEQDTRLNKQHSAITDHDNQLARYDAQINELFTLLNLDKENQRKIIEEVVAQLVAEKFEAYLSSLNTPS